MESISYALADGVKIARRNVIKGDLPRVFVPRAHVRESIGASLRAIGVAGVASHANVQRAVIDGRALRLFSGLREFTALRAEGIRKADCEPIGDHGS